MVKRHWGASFQEGRDLVHAWFSGSDIQPVLSGWQALATVGLAEAPEAHQLSPDSWHVSAATYPFLPLALVERVLACGIEGEAKSRELTEQLRPYSHDAAIFARTYAHYRAAALAGGRPAHLLALGRHMCIVVGAGRRHRIRVMNVSADGSLLAGLVGGRKCAGRDWLRSVGLPVAPGGLADTPDAAVALAARIGGPVVIKRPIGGNGDGVIPSLSDSQGCRSAAQKMLEGHPHVIVERMIPGVELRLHIVNGKIWEVRWVSKRTVTGDGQTPLARLIEHQQPAFLRSVATTDWLRQRLVFVLWGTGVRTFEDLQSIVPAAGEIVTIASGVARGREGLAPRSAIHIRDRERIEAAMETLGSPSGGVDVILRQPGARLADGGAVIEVNIPCGMAYLENPERAARHEFSAWIANDAAFKASKGRVPFVVMPQARRDRLPPGWRQVLAALRARFERVVVHDASESGWMPALMSNADAILMSISERGVLDHGLPLNARPTCIRNAAEETPILDAAIKNCGPVQRSSSSLLLRSLGRTG